MRGVGVKEERVTGLKRIDLIAVAIVDFPSSM
jgi:hypothetical protein